MPRIKRSVASRARRKKILAKQRKRVKRYKLEGKGKKYAVLAISRSELMLTMPPSPGTSKLAAPSALG